MPKSNNKRKKANQERRKKTTKNTPPHDQGMSRMQSGLANWETKVGEFEAPCGSMVRYMTTADFPTLKDYRWHAIQDHLLEGECPDPEAGEHALATRVV